MHNNRNTNFTIPEILTYLRDKDQTSFPDCMLLNDLGAIVLQGEDEKGEAEAYLLEMLTHPSRQRKMISYCFLTQEPLADKHRDALALFRAQNKSLMPQINRALAAAK